MRDVEILPQASPDLALSAQLTTRVPLTPARRIRRWRLLSIRRSGSPELMRDFLNMQRSCEFMTSGELGKQPEKLLLQGVNNYHSLHIQACG